ncbi:MAG: hypothetical protein QNJ37_13985 [Crocosphaera sp.]|nr:hypothetical protein [Crocosphaera sp.]
MSTTADNDLKELKELIKAQNNQLANLQKDMSDLRVSVGKIEATVQNQQLFVQKIPELIDTVIKMEATVENQQPFVQKIPELTDKIGKIEAIVENQQPFVQKIPELTDKMGKIEATVQNQQPLLQKIPDLAEKVGELKNWRQIVIIAVTALISSFVTWAIRGGNIKF